MTKGHYFVVRYMLDELRDEALNVGVILLARSGDRPHARFLDDPSLKSRRDAAVDPEIVIGFQQWLDRYVDGQTGELSVAALEEALRERTGNVIRIRGPHVVLLDDPEIEAHALFNEWVALRGSRSRPTVVGPRDPLGGLRKEAQRAVTATLRASFKGRRAQQAVRRGYEVQGKVHLNRFDAAVIPPTRGIERVFHHVLVLPNPEDSFDQAAALARRWLDVRQANGKSRRLTAVFYRRGSGKVKPEREAEALLHNDKIEVTTLSDLPEVLKGLELQGSLPFVRGR